MRKITIRRKRKKNDLQGWLICFGLTAVFSLMGFSLAAFQSSLCFSGTVGTAEVFVEFEENPQLYAYHFAVRGTEGSDDVNTGSLDIAHNTTIKTLETEKEVEANLTVLRSVFSDYEQKTIEVNVSNACPGDIYRFNYGLVNSGNMPVKITAEIVDDNPRLKIQEPRSDYILNPNDEPFREDLLIIVTKDVLAHSDYGFNMQITYEQWNE